LHPLGGGAIIGQGPQPEPPVSDLEPIPLRGVPAWARRPEAERPNLPPQVSFDRHELREILDVYGRKVAAGTWCDYAIDASRERAVFSIFRRASECPIYRIEKVPRLARRQGAYAVIAAGGLVLRRGHDLARVLGVLDRRLELVG
jgi:hypothetical protein